MCVLSSLLLPPKIFLTGSVASYKINFVSTWLNSDSLTLISDITGSTTWKTFLMTGTGWAQFSILRVF